MALARLASLRRAPRPPSTEAPLDEPTPLDPAGSSLPASQESVRAAPSGRLVDRLPATVRDGQFTVSRAAAAGLMMLALVAVTLSGSYAWRARSVPVGVGALPVQSPASPASPASAAVVSPSAPAAGAPVPSASAVGVVVVDVAGRVRSPGVVRLPAGSRVVDALAAAGGVRGGVDVSGLNLARVLSDGEQVLVGVEGGAPSAGQLPGGPAGVDPGGAVLDLNAATFDQLDTLPGVGPVLAQRIIDWRNAHGRFSAIEELQEVSGIGEARFADLATRVRV